MTYEEKLAIQTAQEVLKHETVSKDLEGVWIDDYTLACIQFVIYKGIKQAMQAQREACLQSSIEAQKAKFGLEYDDLSDWVKEAILNAEVKV